MVPNTVQICTTAPLWYLLIRLKEFKLENICLNDMQNKILGLFADIMTADNKKCFLNCDNLTQPIQMQFSKKQKSLLWFGLSIFEI